MSTTHVLQTPVEALTVAERGRIALAPAAAAPTRFGGTPFPDQGDLGPDEVFGPTICTLLSPGTEIANTFRPIVPEAGTPLPWIPGYASVFEVSQVGEQVQTVRPGDLVYSLGGHRSHQRERVSEVWRLPEGLDPFVGVFARLMSIPMATLATTAARPGAQVGVSGLGPIGHLAAVAFHLSGYFVTAWDPRPERRALLPAGIEVRERAPEPTRRRQHGSIEGLDLVVECSGHDGAALSAVTAVRSGGEVVLVGTPWRRYTDASAFDVMREVFFKYAVLRSGWEWQIPPATEPFRAVSSSQNITRALAWLAEGRVATEALAQRHRPADAQDVYESYTDGTADRLTALFDWRPER